MTKTILTIIIALAATFGLQAYEQTGYASWYGDKFHGRQTANGETFDTYDFTAAHKELPFNTIVRVTNLANGKTVTVRINDRGPFVEGRIIDLSYAAAKELDMVNTGTAHVRLETLDGGELKILYSIQIGAFSNVEYAADMMEKLKTGGFSPTAELSNKGITRVLLKNIPEDDLVPVVSRLKYLGYPNILIKQN